MKHTCLLSFLNLLDIPVPFCGLRAKIDCPNAYPLLVSLLYHFFLNLPCLRCRRLPLQIMKWCVLFLCALCQFPLVWMGIVCCLRISTVLSRLIILPTFETSNPFPICTCTWFGPWSVTAPLIFPNISRKLPIPCTFPSSVKTMVISEISTVSTS